MRELSDKEVSSIEGGISFGKLIAAMTVGAITGLLRGIAGGPVLMIGSAIFGAGMGAAGMAISDASTINDHFNQNK